ncbi:unnamed protein product [Ambrosiozyma monospora]|uniref:Unnamed protein product n=1 Tax=Ambrosiozyma monospora TaxID=43982 RepID=A0A9W7DHW3_AMBMO|nr:unnamed protein product [Ambrosiozyma monospora]
MNPEMATTPPHYIFRNGLRLVQPYYSTQPITVKGRWINKTVLQVFSTEFRDFSEEQHKQSILSNQVKVTRTRTIKDPVTRKRHKSTQEFIGDSLLSPTQFLKSGDLIYRTKHNHEIPVIGKSIRIIHQDTELLVIDKPSGIPIHPVQKYYYNTITEILKTQLGVDQIHPCHRLDKLTSGICILALNPQKATQIQNQIKLKEIQKEYVARVSGILGQVGDELVCDEDVVVVDTKKGFHDGVCKKSARTSFKVMKVNKELNQSVVKCVPETGRTHQIRIHLRNLGCAIVNDPLYNAEMKGLLGEVSGGDGKSVKGDKEQENSDSDVNADADAGAGADGGNVLDKKQFDKLLDRANHKRDVLLTGERCDDCGMPLYKEPKAKDMVLYLHAFKYYTKNDTVGDGPSWSFETKLPDWANI